MPEAGAKEVFRDPTAPTAGIAAPTGAAIRGDGGVRVNGRWSYASGITHCDWVFAGCLVMENGQPRMTPHGPEIIHVWLPVANVTIHDTWYVSGLCGTGSNDFSATDVFVPEQRIFALLDPAGHRKEPLYQMPPVGMFVYQVVCVSLGIARAALDELTEIAQKKAPTLYTQVLADKAATQIDFARAEAALGGARAFLFEAVEEIFETLRSGKTPTMRQIAMGRIAANHAAATAAQVAQTASTLTGGSAIYTALSDATPRTRRRGRPAPLHGRAPRLGGSRPRPDAPRALRAGVLTSGPFLEGCLSRVSKEVDMSDPNEPENDNTEPRDSGGFQEDPATQGLKDPPFIQPGEDSGEWTRGGGTDPNEIREAPRRGGDAEPES